MKRFGVLFFALLFITVIGCNGDDEVEAVPEATPPPEPTPTTVTVAQGTKTVPSGVSTTMASFSIAESGILMATITWSGVPPSVMALFLHEGTTVHGLGTGGSPFNSTATVTDAIVVAGHGWEFIISHGAGADVDCTYVITFTPD